MGRKVHPVGFRLGGVKDWSAHWYASRRQYKTLLAEDIAIRKLVMAKVGSAGVSNAGKKDQTRPVSKSP